MDDLPEELRPLVGLLTLSVPNPELRADEYLAMLARMTRNIQAARRAGWTFTPPKGNGNDG